jgi:hypothetical protein
MGNQHRRSLMIVAVTLSALVLGGSFFHDQFGLASQGGNRMNVARITVVASMLDRKLEQLVAKAIQ